VSELSVLFVGLLLGMKHATEADHLAAVATLATRQTTLVQTLRQGVAWGIGHTLVLLMVGGFVLWLGKTVPARMSETLEFAVGVMLLGLGADVLRRVRRQHRGGQLPGAESVRQVRGLHGCRDSRPEPSLQLHVSGVPGRALMIGMIHGMAGSAAMVLLGLSVAPTVVAGLVYIAIFGLGSILGMALLSAVIAVPLTLSARWLGWLRTSMNASVGTITCGLGLVIVYRIGVTDGLLHAMFS
jgi:hypothetical protein